VKTLEDFKFSDAPHLPAVQIRNLAEGGYLSRSEPIFFLRNRNRQKHLATGLAVAACRQKKRVRFTTAAEMVNELIEAKNQSELNRVTRRWTRYELIVIDELAYWRCRSSRGVAVQVIAGRAERAAVIVTTNLPFSEWTTMFPNARLWQSDVRSVDRSGPHHRDRTESYRFRRTLEKKGGKNEHERMVSRAPEMAVMVEGKEGLPLLARVHLHVPECE